MKELIAIQSELKVPKAHQMKNKGRVQYTYRNQEDILEAVKPLCSKHNCTLTISDTVLDLSGNLIIQATATITNADGQSISVSASAGVKERSFMDIAQSYGASCSYARKYALGGLFLLDDSTEIDAKQQAEPAKKRPEDEKQEPYDKQKFLARVITTKTTGELGQLYRNNLMHFDGDDEVKKAFTARKNQLNGNGSK